MTSGNSADGSAVVWVERSACHGHARCWQTLPEIFLIDEEGFSAIEGDVRVPYEFLDQAELAVDSCPEQALHLRLMPVR